MTTRALVALATLFASVQAGPAPERRIPVVRETFDLAFSPDGSSIALACDERTSLVYSVSEGAPLRPPGEPIPGLTDYAVVFLGAGRVALAGNGLRILETATGREVDPLENVPGNLRALALSPDGTTLAGGGQGATVFLWELATRKQTRVLSGAANTIRSLSWSADGARLAAVSDDGAIWLWSPAGEKLGKLESPGSKPLAARFLGKELLSGHSDGSLRRWDARGENSKLLREASGSPCLSIAVHPRSELAAAGFYDGTTVILDPATGAERTKFRAARFKVHALAFSPDGARLASSQGFVWKTADLLPK